MARLLADIRSSILNLYLFCQKIKINHENTKFYNLFRVFVLSGFRDKKSFSFPACPV